MSSIYQRPGLCAKCKTKKIESPVKFRMCKKCDKRMWWHDVQGKARSLKTRDKKAATYEKNRIDNELMLNNSPFPNNKKPQQTIIDEYESHCQHRNKSKTINDDIKRIEDFTDWANILRITDITESNVKQYLKYRLATPRRIKVGKNKYEDRYISISTINHIITTLKAFVNYAIGQNYINDNLIKNIKKYPEETTPPRFLSKEEIKEFLEHAEKETLYPMIITAMATGLRLGELKALQWDHVDLKQKTITVMKSKSRKFRVIPIHKKLHSVLNKLPKTKKKCFNRINGRRIFDRIALNSKIKGVGWHTLRHTFASHLVMAGTDLATVKELLGHSSITTTMIYTHLSKSHVHESIKNVQL